MYCVENGLSGANGYYRNKAIDRPENRWTCGVRSVMNDDDTTAAAETEHHDMDTTTDVHKILTRGQFSARVRETLWLIIMTVWKLIQRKICSAWILHCYGSASSYSCSIAFSAVLCDLFTVGTIMQ